MGGCHSVLSAKDVHESSDLVSQPKINTTELSPSRLYSLNLKSLWWVHAEEHIAQCCDGQRGSYSGWEWRWAALVSRLSTTNSISDRRRKVLRIREAHSRQ